MYVRKNEYLYIVSCLQRGAAGIYSIRLELSGILPEWLRQVRYSLGRAAVPTVFCALLHTLFMHTGIELEKLIKQKL